MGMESVPDIRLSGQLGRDPPPPPAGSVQVCGASRPVSVPVLAAAGACWGRCLSPLLPAARRGQWVIDRKTHEGGMF